MNNTEELKRRLAKEGSVTELDTRDAYAVEWTVAAMSKGNVKELPEVMMLDGFINDLVHNTSSEPVVLLQKLFWAAIDAIQKAATQPDKSNEAGFTLEDLIDAYGSGYNKAGAEWQDSEHSKPDDEPTMGQYFKEKFGIDLESKIIT